MNDIQNIIDRQLGIYTRFNYDNVLKRLTVHSEESFYGLQNATAAAEFEHDPPLFACRFAEAAGYEHILALANEDGRVAIQDTTTAGRASSLQVFECHNNAVFDLAWVPQHMSFVTVSGDHSACLWDVAESTPKKVLCFSNHTRSVKTVAFRPSEPSVFATGGRDGHIHVWDTRANNQSVVVYKPDNCLMNCHSSFTPKTPRSHGKRARIDNQRAISITGLVFQDDNTLISCGECDGNIKVWDLRKNYNVYKREPLPKHSIPYCGSSTKNGYTNLVIDEARVRLYASCMDDVIYCFNISTYNSLPEQRYVGHENSSFYIKTSLSPDNMYLVSGSSDKNAYIWNVKYSQPIVKLSGHWAEVTCAAWCQKGATKVVTCSDDARHNIWRIGREFPEHDAQLRGRAEVVPRAEVTYPPHWGTSDKTPNSLKRKAHITRTTPTSHTSHSAKRSRSTTDYKERRTKRCLTDLLNASKDIDEAGCSKRLKCQVQGQEHDENKLLPTGTKRHRDENESSPPTKIRFPELEASTDWKYLSPQPSTSFMTPTKNYEKKNCKLLSPRSPKSILPTNRSPVKVSPMKVRTISFTTPTKNLPNFVLDGEAPHLKLMSPVKKKQDTTNWLTRIVREKKGKATDTEHVAPPSSPKETIPARRNSLTERTQRSNKSRTLLKYFSVASKEK